MKNYSAFDIIGPRMIGPSSSHTAGAARIGKVAGKICGKEIKKAVFVLYGSFAKTYKGHGTDRALVAGILGMEPNDEHLAQSLDIARAKGIELSFVKGELEDVHPNTVKIIMIDVDDKQTEIVGSSIGGGNIVIVQINGLDLEFTGEYQTIIIHHIDRPGIIADVTKIIGEFGINIAFMKVFRQSKGEDAFMIIESDNNILEEVLAKIQNLRDEIINVYLINSL